MYILWRERLKNFFSGLHWASTCALAVVTTFLLYQNLEFRNALTASARPPALTPGMVVPALRGMSLQGSQEVIDTRQTGRSALVLVFAPSCGACARNWSSWSKLLQSPVSKQYQIVGIEMTGALDPTYSLQHGLLPQSVLVAVPPVIVGAYRLGLTPQTILVSQGKIGGVWTGILDDDKLREIQLATRKS
jgi:hypothetical protein